MRSKNTIKINIKYDYWECDDCGGQTSVTAIAKFSDGRYDLEVGGDTHMAGSPADFEGVLAAILLDLGLIEEFADACYLPACELVSMFGENGYELDIDEVHNYDDCYDDCYDD